MDHDRTDTSRLVSLAERRRARRHPALVQVEGYWDSLRGDRLMPDRAEVDPRGLSGALEHAFVLERIAPGLARFRVAGVHLSDLMGLEVRGMPISATFAPEARPELSRALESAFGEPARIQMGLEGEGGIGRPALAGEMILMPLRADGGEVTRALGCVVMDGSIGRQPRRMKITSLSHQTLTGYGQRRDPLDEPVPNLFTEDTGADTPQRAPYLRLVHSAD